MRVRRHLITAAAVLAAAVVLPLAPVSAQNPAVMGVSITPGVVETQVASRQVDLSFTVANNDPAPLRVNLSVRELGQTLDGSMTYGAPSPLRAEPAQLVLAPGQHGAVRVSGSLPPDAAALYAGVLAEPVGRAPSGQVEIRTRVAALLLLTTPGDHARSVEVTDVMLTPTAEERTYRVGATLRNTGQVHVRPQGTVAISEPGGPVLGTATLTGAVLLPGASRLLDGGLWSAPPPPLETVRLDAEITDPVARGAKSVSLPEPADQAGTPGVGPGGGLGTLGGGDNAGGVPWLVILAVLLLLAVSALLAWTQSRRLGTLSRNIAA